MCIIAEDTIYENIYKTIHECNSHILGEQIIKNDVYIKLLKISRYKQKIQKKKKSY